MPAKFEKGNKSLEARFYKVYTHSSIELSKPQKTQFMTVTPALYCHTIAYNNIIITVQ